jgi:hypothetical protein
VERGVVWYGISRSTWVFQIGAIYSKWTVVSLEVEQVALRAEI